MYNLEVCVDNIESARQAEMGGADRIELCQALEVGGLTPSIGLIRKVKEMLDIPVFVMIRPRSGNFFYNTSELDQMEEDIRATISIGADGLVFGALHKTGIDREACQQLINVSNGLPVTFHRAFDLVQNPDEAAVDIINLGFSRILTSGQSPSAYEGMKKIAELVEKFDSQIMIMPGCGINECNLPEIKAFTKAREYHSSCQPRYCNPPEENVVKGTAFHSITSMKIVKNMKALLK